MSLAEKTQSVYFITYKDGPIKIGKAIDVSRRLKGLQTSVPYKLYCLGIIEGRPELEGQLHIEFSGLRLNGEWFSRHPSLLSYIENRCDIQFSETGILKKLNSKKRASKALQQQMSRPSVRRQVDEFEECLIELTTSTLLQFVLASRELNSFLNKLESQLQRDHGIWINDHHIVLAIRRTIDKALETKWMESRDVLQDDNFFEIVRDNAKKLVKRNLLETGWYKGAC